jgi:signal transduction histidine kinase
VPRRVPILAKLLVATLVPTAATFAAFGLLAHYIARLALEAELGRRLVSVAAAAELAVRSERPDLLAPGDEESRTYRNVRRKLRELRDATRVERVYLFDAASSSRGDTDEGVPLGARYYALDADRAELRRVLAGEPASSLLFVGKGGGLHKSGFAPLHDEAGAVVGAVGVDGSAALYDQLADFRRIVYVTAGAGLLAAIALSVLLARRITRPLGRLERAARTIGEGDLAVPIPVEARTRHFYDEIGYLAAALEEMRQQLRARDERLQMMLAGIAHEVRNPLGGMELFAGLLREELEGDADKLVHVRRIERELGHLKTVVTEFLEYARRPRPELRPVDGATLVREVQQVLAAEAAARPSAQAASDAALAAGAAPVVRVTVEAPDSLPLEGDPVQLRRALLNLGRNALQALGDGGGEVALACRLCDDDDGAVHFVVRDTGRGIEPAIRERLFDPFFTTREKGTGLGLAFVAEIARDHGGEVRVESEPGRGATFTLVVPRGQT